MHAVNAQIFFRDFSAEIRGPKHGLVTPLERALGMTIDPLAGLKHCDSRTRHAHIELGQRVLAGHPSSCGRRTTHVVDADPGDPLFSLFIAQLR